jgi:hypothetical protein
MIKQLKWAAAVACLPLAAVSLTGCGGEDGGSGGPIVAPTPTPTPPETSQQFVARTSRGPGTSDLAGTPATFTLTGCLRKNKTDNPRSLGAAAFLNNMSGVEYRIMRFAYVLETNSLLPGESAQSDNGFTILRPGEYNSLNSGEEVLITHQDDASVADRGIFETTLPVGGIALPAGYRLSIGSVSSIFPLTGGEAKIVDDARLGGDGIMRMCYQADLIRADTALAPAVVGYRSPYRDLSFVADPARTLTPYTDFRNTSDRNVRVHGISIFYSTSTVTQPSDQEVDLLVNGTRVRTIALPPRRPGVSTASTPLIFPLDIQLRPGDVLGARGRVTANLAIVFDIASFLFADAGLEPINEQLDVLPIDVNGDGYNDIIDIDALGALRVALRVGTGLQDTQQEWTRGLGRSLSLQVLPRGSSADPLFLRATNPLGMCLNLRADPAFARFLIDYCQVNGAPSLPTDLWGDFNGDGFVDRLRVDPGGAYLVALGSASGLRPAAPWVIGYGPVARMFVSDANGDGKDDFVAEWADVTGFRCLIWESTGTAFVQRTCPQPLAR